MDDFGRQLGCLLYGMITIIAILLLIACTLAGLIIAGVL